MKDKNLEQIAKDIQSTKEQLSKWSINAMPHMVKAKELMEQAFQAIGTHIKSQAKETPISEQVWEHGLRDVDCPDNIALRDHGRSLITYNNEVIAYIPDADLVKVFLGVPALVEAADIVYSLIMAQADRPRSDAWDAKAWLEETLPNLQVVADLRDALEAMGVE